MRKRRTKSILIKTEKLIKVICKMTAIDMHWLTTLVTESKMRKTLNKILQT